MAENFIDSETSLQAKTANDFEKDLFKLMNKSVFIKTIQNVTKRVIM